LPSARAALLLPGSPRARRRLLAVLALLPLLYFLKPSQPLNPQVYSDHPVSSVAPVGPAHVELVVPVSDAERGQFGPGAVVFSPYGVPPRPPSSPTPFPTASDSGAPLPGTVVVQHIMVKNPDLMIERAYTPVNDVAADGRLRMVVKRVPGGEVGRCVPPHQS
jgi:cytochrome-b5 reductase